MDALEEVYKLDLGFIVLESTALTCCSCLISRSRQGALVYIGVGVRYLHVAC
jgi:hypothetical protein